jgi:hypothetical protein
MKAHKDKEGIYRPSDATMGSMIRNGGSSFGVETWCFAQTGLREVRTSHVP